MKLVISAVWNGAGDTVICEVTDDAPLFLPAHHERIVEGAVINAPDAEPVTIAAAAAPTLADYRLLATAHVTEWEAENKNAALVHEGETYACDDLAESRFLKVQAAITEHGFVAPHCDESGNVKWWAASGPVTLSESGWSALTLLMLNQRYMYENAAIYLREAAIPAAADLAALNALLSANGVETVGG